MDPEDQAVFRSDEGPVISVTQITEHEVKFKFVAFIGSHPLVVEATATPGELQELITNAGYTVQEAGARPLTTEIIVEDLENAGISIAQGDS